MIPSFSSSSSAHPRVRAALERSGLGTAERPAELDEGTIRLAGPQRAIDHTSSGSGDLRGRPRPAGFAYRSRLDDHERCWALYGHTPVRFDPPEWLAPDVPEHAKVRSAARFFGLPVPSDWLARDS